MAKVRTNIFVRGLQGDLGKQFYVGTGLVSGRTNVNAMIDKDRDRDYTPAQLAQQQSWREAIAYAKDKQGEQIYIEKADGAIQSPYNIAMADYLNRPQLLEVDLTGWKGGPNDVIRLRAYDDVKVAEVRVQLGSDDGVMLEEGLAVDKGALWWEYAPTGGLTGKLQVTITAKDLPGHIVEYSQVRTISAS